MIATSYYTEEELNTLKEKWRKEEERLNNLDDYWNIEDGAIKEETDGITNARLNYERKQFKQRKKYLDYPETDSKLELEDTTYAVFADCMMIKVPHMIVPGNRGGKRGKCVGFSPASRLRMKKRLAKLNIKGKYCFFISLTYPEKYIKDMRVSKRDLDVFRKAFAREFESFIGGIWRLERQKRGAPHYHMLLVSDKPISQKKIIEFIKRRWADIVRTSYVKSGGDEKEYREHYERHVNSGHNVQFMKSREMVQNYISKYIAKVDEDTVDDEMGRIWGQWQFNGKKLDFTPYETGHLAREETVLLKRMVRKHKEASNRLTLREQELIDKGNKSGVKDKEAVKKLRRHKKDKKYAKRISKQNTITLFGYGMESGNGAVIKKMLDASRLSYAQSLVERDCGVAGCVSSDLINMHISPSSVVTRDEKPSEVGNVLGDIGDGGRGGSVLSPVAKGDRPKEKDVGVCKRPPPVFTEEEWRKGEELQLRRVREYRERYGLSERD